MRPAQGCAAVRGKWVVERSGSSGEVGRTGGCWVELRAWEMCWWTAKGEDVGGQF